MTAPGLTRGDHAVDLFAGHGWGVAAHRLGLIEHAVEIMPEAIGTREANGMGLWMRDVWEVLEHAPTDSPEFTSALLIASPPCQTFSMAGGGAGRKALDEVVGLIDSKAYRSPAALREFGERHDPRTSLVLTPLAYAYRHLPTYIVLEQVPPVLPVWKRMAEELERWGYSTWVGILNAEQYGVPQTRRRAILIARADGEVAAPPTPTHSRYYPRDPKRLDEGVLPWVSMAEALGWDMTARPFVTAGGSVGRAEGIGGSGGKAAVNREKDRGEWHDRPAPTITGGGTGSGGGVEVFGGKHSREVVERMRSNYGTGGDPADRGERDLDEPAPTMTSKAGRNHWVATQVRLGQGKGRTERHGPRGGRPVEEPAYTVLGGEGGNSQPGFGIKRTINLDPAKPATTVQGDPRLTAREHHHHGEQNSTSTRVTIEEAAALQGYPPGFIWEGDYDDPKTGKRRPITKTKAFLQVGNAVPPLLAEAILGSLFAREDG